MTDTNDAQSATSLRGYLGLAAAVLVALGAVTYLFLSAGGDDETGAAPDSAASATPRASESPAAGGELGPLESHRPEVGEPAPDFALESARAPGEVLKLSDFRGKAVVVNWYASWCGPCKREIPAFQAAQDALGDQVVFLGVDFQETRENAVGILEELGGTYPAVLDPTGEVADHYGVIGLPATYFIDADGVLRAQKAGEVTVGELEEFLAEAGVEYEAADEG